MNDETDGRTDGWMLGECSMLRQSVADYLRERVIIREELGWGIGYQWGRGEIGFINGIAMIFGRGMMQ